MTERVLPSELLERGVTAVFRKTLAESDVYLFAGITGDFFRAHTDEEYMRTTCYGRRIAHGALIVGFMSAAAARLLDRVDVAAVSYGYDRIRFIAPVFFGDTIAVECRVTGHDDTAGKIFTDVVVTNQDGTVIAAATHIIKLV